MKIAIVGSREIKQMDLVEETLYAKINYLDVEIITGGARGVDKFAEYFAKRIKRPCEVIRPINPANKLDYLFRNVEIITKADKIIAFWDGNSRGTKFVIDYAKARGKDIEVIKSEKSQDDNPT